MNEHRSTADGAEPAILFFCSFILLRSEMSAVTGRRLWI